VKKKMIYINNNQYVVEVDIFDVKDLKNICSIYQRWASLSNDLSKLGCRRLNFPEISEIFFCILDGSWRINATSIHGEHSSFDCYNPDRKTRIQVKSASSKKELTSFGPKSKWDELYFLDLL